MLKLSKIETLGLNTYLRITFEHMYWWLERHLPYAWRKHGFPGQLFLVLLQCPLVPRCLLFPPVQRSLRVRNLWLHFFETVPPQQTGEQCFAMPCTLAPHKRFKDTWLSFIGSAQRFWWSSPTELCSLCLTPWLARPVAIALCRGLHPWHSLEWSLW